MKAILVSVEYADLLALTLPYNRHHFSEVFVVTTPSDKAAHQIAEENRATIIPTELFYAHGAEFNKWAALEFGLNVMGREGWMCLMDADVLWPKQLPRQQLQFGCLYTPLRRMCDVIPLEPPAEASWRRYPLDPLRNHWSGYSQIFNAGDPALYRLPWFDANWRHAGGGDSVFQERWRPSLKRRPAFEVLHLGENRQNWCGRVTPFADGSQSLEAEQRRQRLEGYMRKRTGRGQHRFDHERL